MTKQTNSPTDTAILLASPADERAYLAAAFLDGTVLENEPLPTDAFVDPRHRLIFRAMRVVYGRAGTLDIGSVAALLQRHGLLEKAGGFSYLSGLIAEATSSLLASHHAAVLRDLYWRRSMARALEDAMRKVQDAGARLEDVQSVVERAGDRVSQAVYVGLTAEPLHGVLNDLANLAEERARERSQGKDLTWPWPWPGVRQVVTPEPGEFVIVAGRPGMGKSAFAAGVAAAAAAAGKRVLYATLEMSEAQVAARIVSWMTGVPASVIRNGTATPQQIQAIRQTAARVRSWKFGLFYQPGMTPMTLAQEVRRFAQKHKGIDLLVVDYLGIMRPDGRDYENVYARMTHISQRVMALAGWVGRQWGGWVLAAHQLSRAVLGRNVKRPRLDDMRDSGALEQDASRVLFLYHPDGEDPPTDPALPPAPKQRMLYLAKNRFGESGQEWAMMLKPSTGELVEALTATRGVADDLPPL